MKKYKKCVELPETLLNPTTRSLDSYVIYHGKHSNDQLQRARMIRSIISDKSWTDKVQYIYDFIAFNNRLLKFATHDGSGETLERFCNIVYCNLDELMHTKINRLNPRHLIPTDFGYSPAPYTKFSNTCLSEALTGCIENLMGILYSIKMDESFSGEGKTSISISLKRVQSVLQMEPDNTYLAYCFGTMPINLVRLPSANFDEVCLEFGSENKLSPNIAFIRTYSNNDTDCSMSLDCAESVGDVALLRKRALGHVPVVAFPTDVSEYYTVDSNFKRAIEAICYSNFKHPALTVYTTCQSVSISDYRAIFDTSNTFGIMCERKSSVKSDSCEEEKESENLKERISANEANEMCFRTPIDMPYKAVVRYICDVLDDTRIDEVYMTLYRVAENSTIVEHLQKAAMRGCKIRLYIELNASGNELENLRIYQMLSQLPNVKLYYGLTGMKVHAKMFAAHSNYSDTDLIALNPSQEFNHKLYFTHVGTGNYNEKTGEQYIDTHFITNEESKFNELKRFFKAIASKHITCRVNGMTFQSMVLPHNGSSNVNEVKSTIQDLIQNVYWHLARTRRGSNTKRAEIIFKCNHLLDYDIEKELITFADQYHDRATIYLIVRSTCGIIPRPGIVIIRPVGELLEHDRIYAYRLYDAKGKCVDKKAYISSADLMYRNLYNRAELIQLAYWSYSDQYNAENVFKTLDMYIDAFENTENAESGNTVYLTCHGHNMMLEISRTSDDK